MGDANSATGHRGRLRQRLFAGSQDSLLDHELVEYLLFLAVPQIAAALVAGNAVIWKPAPAGAPLASRAAAIFYRAGLPQMLLQMALGGADVAREVVHNGVDKLFFTGGSAAGAGLTSAAR